MFETLKMAPPDPILGLTEAFVKDPNPSKTNLGAGVYKDARGKTPVFQSVRRAQERLLREETTKTYVSPNSGTGAYSTAVQEMLFGEGHEIVTGGRAATAQSPGGTGALRLAGDFIHRMLPGAKVWVSEPTWANHPNVFLSAGLEVGTYPYSDAATNGLAFGPMLEALKAIPKGDVVLLHGCCHNPTGIDPTPQQWEAIADVVRDRHLLPLVDFAYQGLGDGLREDAGGLMSLCRPGQDVFVASSYSKNFGLYCERVGALTAVTPSHETAEIVLSQLKVCIRTNYSNPPGHGSGIVTTVWNDPELRAEWEDEVKGMCDRINRMRSLFVDTLERKGVKRDFSFIARQRGMFSFSGLTPEQVDALRERHAIYIVRSGRINVAGMTEDNMDRLCEAIAEVLG